MTISKTGRTKRPKRNKKRTKCGATPVAKHMYETEEEAEMQMRFIQALYTGGSRRLPRRVYYCSFCKHWHLTSNRPQETLTKEMQAKRNAS